MFLNFFDKLKAISTDKTPSGRVANLTLAVNGEEKKITSDQLRAIVGYTKIKSAIFDYQINGSEISFTGVGSGHGVGMCQWGARYLAKTGLNFKQILAHYYPEIALQEFH